MVIVVRERRRRDREVVSSNGSSNGASLSRSRGGRGSSNQLIGPELTDDEDERYANRRLSYSGQHQMNY